jgi:thioredoxin 1
MATKAVTDASFAADVLSDKPVLVDFWADWCGPCKMIGPALEEISEELADKVTIAKVDIMENTDISTKYGRAVDPVDGAVQEWRTGSAKAGRRAEEPAQGLAGKRSVTPASPPRQRRGFAIRRACPSVPPVRPTAPGWPRRAGRADAPR